jgi:hypothetical protein
VISINSKGHLIDEMKKCTAEPSFHRVAREILFQAEDDRNFVAAAITPRWVIRDANMFGYEMGSVVA